MRRTLNSFRTSKGGSVQEQLLEEKSQGRLRSKAHPKLVHIADQLEKSGILSSREWMDGRNDKNLRGAVGEKLALEEMYTSAPKGALVLSRIRFLGLLFEDVAMTQPARNNSGGKTDVTSELDILVTTEKDGRFQYSCVANVKVAAPQQAKSVRIDAINQNRVALDALRAHQEGRPVQIKTQSGQTLYGPEPSPRFTSQKTRRLLDCLVQEVMSLILLEK